MNFEVRNIGNNIVHVESNMESPSLSNQSSTNNDANVVVCGPKNITFRLLPFTSHYLSFNCLPLSTGKTVLPILTLATNITSGPTPTPTPTPNPNTSNKRNPIVSVGPLSIFITPQHYINE